SHEPDCYLPELRVIELEAFAEPLVSPTSSEFRLRFECPECPQGSRARLLLRHFGAEQAVLLDGEPAGTFRQGDSTLPELALSERTLRPRAHELVIAAPPHADERAKERAERVPRARLVIQGPPPVWRRSLFNGLAQVIVQSSGEPGLVTLRATSPGLAEA